MYRSNALRWNVNMDALRPTPLERGAIDTPTRSVGTIKRRIY